MITALFTVAHAQNWSTFLDPSRATTWQGNVGFTIPTYTVPCTTQPTLLTGSGNASANRTAIQNALASCDAAHNVVNIPAGTYYVAGFAFGTQGSQVLRGAGSSAPGNVCASGSTCLILTSNNNCSGVHAGICMMGATFFYPGSAAVLPPSGARQCLWTAGYAQGSTSITLNSCGSSTPTSNGLVVGQQIVLDQSNDLTDNGGNFKCDSLTTSQAGGAPACTQNDGSPTNFDGRSITTAGKNYTNSQKQIAIVQSVSGSGTGPYTVTISPGVYFNNIHSGANPGAWFPGTMQNEGLENVYIDGSALDTHNVEIVACNKCWVKGVSSYNAARAHISPQYSSQTVVRDNYFFQSQSHASQSYGIEPEQDSADLYENNIFQQLTDGIMTGNCSGCVVGYNFEIGGVYVNSNYLQGSFASHNAGNDMNLWEGNNFYYANVDSTWGSSDVDTFFREFHAGWRKQASAPIYTTNGFIARSFARNHNIIGNVFGQPSYHTNYESYATSTTTGTNQNLVAVSIYSLGWSGTAETTAGTCTSPPGTGNAGCDSLVRPTLMRWGNYDTVNAGIKWDSTEASPAAVTYVNANFSSGYFGSLAHTLPASLYYNSTPSWWPSGKAWPPIGPDVTNGNVGICTGTYTGAQATNASQCTGGTLNTAWASHVTSLPAQDCYFAMGGVPDGTGAALAFQGCPILGALDGFVPGSLGFPLTLVGVSSTPQSVVLTNTGTAPLVITSSTTTGDFARTTTCGATLAVGASCTFSVTFTPTAGGPRTGILQVVDNATGSPHQLPLSGSGLIPGVVISGNNVQISGNVTITVASATPPIMGIAPSSLAFGTVTLGSVPTLPLVVTNTGGSNLVFSSIVLANTSDYSETDNCTTVVPLGTCNINVIFSPHSVAALNTTITLNANDATSPHIVNITGTGVAASPDIAFPDFTTQGGIAFLAPQAGPDSQEPFTQTIQQTVYIGNSTCPLAPARTNYLGQSKSATVCDYADSNGTGLKTTMTDWCAAADQRWDVVVTHGSSFNFASTPWSWCTKYSGVATQKYIVFHSDTPNPRGRMVCSHGLQDVLAPPLPDMGQRNHGCQGFLGFPAITAPLPITNAAYTFDATYNDLANMWTMTSTSTGVGTVINMGAASTLGDPFGDCAGACPTDGVNHIVLQDSRIFPDAGTTAAIIPFSVKAAEWFAGGATVLSTHYLPASPHDIHIDENYFTADADEDGFGNNAITDIVQFACKNCTFNHNYMDSGKKDGSEDHCFNISDSIGPLQTNHNWFEGCSIAYWGGGGSPPAITDLLTKNIERRRNRITYNMRWAPYPAGVQSIKKTVTSGSCTSNVITFLLDNSKTPTIGSVSNVVYLKSVSGVGSITAQWYTASSVTSSQIVVPTTCTNGAVTVDASHVPLIYGFGAGVTVTSAAAMNGKAVSNPVDNNPVAKNRTENKQGDSVIEDGDIVENCAADGQSGFCLLLTVRAIGGAAWGVGGQNFEITDWATTNTIIRNANQGIQISARSGGSNNTAWTVTNAVCAGDGNSVAITATKMNAGLSAPLTTQTVYGTDIYLSGMGNGNITGTPLLANGFYATAYPTGGNYSNDTTVTAIGTGICAASNTTATGTAIGPESNNGAGVTKPGRRYVFNNNLIYGIGNHTLSDGGGTSVLMQNGGGVNNWSVNMTVIQVTPTLIVNAAVQAINSCPVSQLCPKVLQASVGDLAYVQCLADPRFSSGGINTKGAPMLSVASDQLSFTFTPQNGGSPLTLSDTTSCPIAPLDGSTPDSGYYGSQSFPWPFYWNHNTAVGVNNFTITPGGGGYNKFSTFKNSFQLLPGASDVAPANIIANAGGFRGNNSDKYSSTDQTGVTFSYDRTGLTFKNYTISTRSISNNPNFTNGTICGSVPCSQDPAVNAGTNTVPARVSSPGVSVTCSGVPCDATHFLPDSIGFIGSMSTSNYPLALSDFRQYGLDPSSPYRAGGVADADDGTDSGVNMSILLNAQNRTLYPCPLTCGTGFHRDGPQYGWLTWSAPPGTVNYRVYRDGAVTPTATTTNIYYTDYGLAPGSHTWVVMSYNGSTETPVSGLVTTVY